MGDADRWSCPRPPSSTMTSSTFLDHLGIQRARRLVEEQDLRAHAKGTGDGDLLLLPARRGCAGSLWACSRSGPAPRYCIAWASASARRRLAHLHRRQDQDSSSTLYMGEEIELLEKTIPTLGTDGRDVARVLREASMPSTWMRPASWASRRLMQRIRVDLPDPRRAADHHLLAGTDSQIDALQRPAYGSRRDHLSTPAIFDHLGAGRMVGEAIGLFSRADSTARILPPT